MNSFTSEFCMLLNIQCKFLQNNNKTKHSTFIYYKEIQNNEKSCVYLFV